MSHAAATEADSDNCRNGGYDPEHETSEHQDLTPQQVEYIDEIKGWLHQAIGISGIPYLLEDESAENESDISELTELCEKTSRAIQEVFNQYRSTPDSYDLYIKLVSFREEIQTEINKVFAKVQSMKTFSKDNIDLFEQMYANPNETGQPFDMPAQKMVSTISNIAKSHGSRLNVIISHDGHDVYIDEMRLIRLMTNFFTNTQKYTPEGSTIDVNIRDLGNHSLIQVLDDGPGFESKDPMNLLEMHVQDKKEHTKTGFGIGLADCRNLINQLNGELIVSNRANDNDGKQTGAMFTIYLPKKHNNRTSGIIDKPW